MDAESNTKTLIKLITKHISIRWTLKNTECTNVYIHIKSYFTILSIILYIIACTSQCFVMFLVTKANQFCQFSGRLDTYQRTAPEVSGKRWRGTVGSDLVGLGSSLPEKWMVERWTRPIYSGNMLVSGSEVLFYFFVVLSSSKRTSTNFGHRRWTPDRCLWTPNRFFSAPERGRIETDLGSGTGRRSSGRSGEDFFSFWMDDPLGFFIRAMDFCSKDSEDFPWAQTFFF